ncbi:MAG TPA: hypothetical protein PLA83_00565 [Deltaproteobacteria bacterium]|nr:hypothetical protein [Deltaproteobacteria bacterium]HQI01033.1 hypothetical protein [Deltaproteobacteria bacterium]
MAGRGHGASCRVQANENPIVIRNTTMTEREKSSLARPGRKNAAALMARDERTAPQKDFPKRLTELKNGRRIRTTARPTRPLAGKGLCLFDSAFSSGFTASNGIPEASSPGIRP